MKTLWIAVLSLGVATGAHLLSITSKIERNLQTTNVTAGAVSASARSRTIADGRSEASTQSVVETYGKLGLNFEVNRGQLDPSVQFAARGSELGVFLRSAEAVLVLQRGRVSGQAGKVELVHDLSSLGSLIPAFLRGSEQDLAEEAVPSGQPMVMSMKLVGARVESQGVGVEELEGRSNYFVGDDPAKWRTNIATYAKVKYASVYPGIDLVFHGNQQQLEYDFVVNPGGDPGRIQMDLGGSEKIFVDQSTGDLVLGSQGEEVRFQKPVVYQAAADARKQFVDGRFILMADHRAGFEVGPYDHTKSLIIDPTLTYATYVGGMLPDASLHVAVDANGSAYITGLTVSPDFPKTTGALSTSLNIGVCGGQFSNFQQLKHFPCPDAFVTKLNASGTGVVFSTFLGGTRSDIGIGIAVDSTMNVYVAGDTESSDFPTTNSGFQHGTALRPTSAFVAKLDPTGSQLLYSTFLGATTGNKTDNVHISFATSIAADNMGHAYVAGYTRSDSFPTTPGVFQPSPGGGTACPSPLGNSVCPDAFVAKLDTMATGAASLVYSTYLGGSSYEAATSIGIDGLGNAYITGTTLSTDFPTKSPFQAAGPVLSRRCGPHNGHTCASAFVTKLNATGTALLFSTYLGGSADTMALGVAVDPQGAAYVTGATNSNDFPASTGVAQHALAAGTCPIGANNIPCPDAFVAKFNPTGTLGYATFLGGSSADIGFGIAVDSMNFAYVTGVTFSTNFPTANAFQGASGGGTCMIRSNGTPNNFACPDAFLTKLDATGSTLLMSSYFGGANADGGTGVAVDNLSNAYITGATLSTGLATTGAFQTSPKGLGDAFIAKISTSANADFTLGAAPGSSTSAAVTAGYPTTYNLQVNPISGFTGTVSLACTGAPPQGTCTPSTSSVNITGASAAPFSVTVTTMARGLLPQGPNIRSKPQGPRFMPFVLCLLALLILSYGLVFPNGTQKPRYGRAFACFVLACLASLVAGCGGGYGGGGGGGGGGTPANTYTLTVTGSDQGVQRSVSLSLKVN